MIDFWLLKGESPKHSIHLLWPLCQILEAIVAPPVKKLAHPWLKPATDSDFTRSVSVGCMSDSDHRLHRGCTCLRSSSDRSHKQKQFDRSETPQIPAAALRLLWERADLVDTPVAARQEEKPRRKCRNGKPSTGLTDTYEQNV